MNILYIKYNRERLPEFQTETVIIKDNNRIYVKKKGLTAKASLHIKTLYANYILLLRNYKNAIIAPSYLHDNEIVFDYIAGESLDAKLIEFILKRDLENFLVLLTSYMNFLCSLGNKIEVFKGDQRFIEVFGVDAKLKDVVCLQIANIDMLFDNIILDSNMNYTIIDYEWVFEFPVPVDFVFYRAMHTFFRKYDRYLEGIITLADVFTYLNIPIKYVNIFDQLECGFQKYVFGQDELYRINQGYLKDSKEIFDIQEELEVKNKKLSEIQEELEVKNKKLSEIQEELDVKNEELSAQTQRLLISERSLDNILTSDGWRLLQRYYKIRDFFLPYNSKRRFLLKLLIKCVKHPTRYIKHVSINNIKKFIYYYKTNNVGILENRIDNYLDRYIEKNKLRLQLFDQSASRKELLFEKHEEPLVSIIIPVYNQFHYTYSCLQSILENTGQDILYEVIIADDVSNDETVNILNYIKNIKVIRNEVNMGFLRNCNNAAQYARGKYLLFLNNDTNVQVDWLKFLVYLIESDETIGLVGSKLVYPDGRLQEAGGIIWKDTSGWNYGRLDDPNKPEYNYVKEVDYISGASIMIRKSLWDEIGGFDDRYAPAYFEDSDLAFEVRKHGYKVKYQPKSVVVHFEGISHGTDTTNGVKSYQVKNKEKFITKWRDVLERDHFKNSEDVFWARDRSGKKKTILVIDHYVPHYDKDAGSRTTYQYLKLFIEMGLNVKFLGDNFFKHEPYTTTLEQLGIEVLYGSWYEKHFKDWLRKNGKYIDYAYLNRPHISVKYVDLIREFTNAEIIYYGHDLHFLRERREYVTLGNKEILKSVEKWKAIEYSLFNKVDVVYYPSQIEVDEIKKDFPKIKARTIPAYIFDYITDKYGASFTDRRDILFVGGFSHKPNIDAVVWFVKDIFPSILENIPDIKFFVVGSNPPDVIKDLRSKNVVVTGYVTDKELEQYYNKCRLVVVPLRYGAGVKGKVVEALYQQVPIVTTSIGAEGLTEVDNILTIADDENDFANRVVELYQDIKTLEVISRNSAYYIQRYFSGENAKKAILVDIKP